jgi:DNA-binding CsgD family transcriptional regulator
VQDRNSKLQDEMIAALYAAAAELVPSSRPLELLAELTRSDKAFVGHYNLGQSRGSILATFNIEPHFVETYKELYASQNPWLARASYFQAEGLVWRGSEIVDPARLRETEFYKLFLYGQAIGPTAHLVIRVRGADVIHVMLTRRSLTEDYDAASLDVCRLYAGHARHASEIADAGAVSRFVQDGIDTAVDDMAIGVAIVEPPATILHMNATFSSLVLGVQPAARFQNSLPPRFSRLSRPAGEARLPRPLADALSSRVVPSFCNLDVAADEAARPISIAIRPVRLPAGFGGASRSGFALIARTADAPFEVDEAPLRAAYLLTAAEARVCSALISGENVHVLSERLGISPQTARTHLKRIYDKTATTRQAELLRLLMTFAYRKPPQAPKPDPRDLLMSKMMSLRPDRGFARKE